MSMDIYWRFKVEPKFSEILQQLKIIVQMGQ